MGPVSPARWTATVLVDSTGPVADSAWVVEISEDKFLCMRAAHSVAFDATMDVDYSVIARRMSVAFGGFYDGESTIESFDWSIGTSRTMDDVLPWVEIGPPTIVSKDATPLMGSYATVTPLPPNSNQSCSAQGDVRTICKQGFQYWTRNDTVFLPNFLLERPRTYYNRVRAWNKVRLYVEKVSDGIRVLAECASSLTCTQETASTCKLPVDGTVPDPTPVKTFDFDAHGLDVPGGKEVITSVLHDSDFAATYAGGASQSSISAVDNIPPFRTFLGASVSVRVFDGLDEFPAPALSTPATVSFTWQAAAEAKVNRATERVDVIVWNAKENRWQEGSSTCPNPGNDARVENVAAMKIDVKICIIGQLALVKTKTIGLTANALSCVNSGCLGAVHYAKNGDSATCYCDPTCETFGDCCDDFRTVCKK
eukprot:Opistho-1_new@92915